MLTNALRRPNTLAVVPRFEHRFGSVSVPVILNDWRSLRLGLAARLGPLVVGSDNLSSFTRKDRLTGLDFYIGLKINAFSLKLADKWAAFRAATANGAAWDASSFEAG